MKRLLFTVSRMNVGGVEKSLLSLISTIPKENYEVTILMLEKKGEFLKEIPSWIKVEEAEWYTKIKPIIMQPPRQTLKDFCAQHKYIKALSFLFIYFISKFFNNRYLYYKYVMKDIQINPIEYDIAISYQGPTDILDFYVGNKVQAKKKISWVHFDVSKHKINEKLYKKLYKPFSKIYVVSKEAKRKLIDKIPSIVEKTEVFLNIVSKNVITELAQEKTDFDADYNGVKVVTVGRLSFEKGQDIAIKALHKLRLNGYKVRWYCIGEGNNRKQYEEMIEKYGLSEDFILVGSKINPYPYMANADIYVQPSRHEGYCLTLAEAKCLHKPIISTDFIGAYEQIINENTGYIVECDEEAIYEKIKFFIENPIIMQSLSDRLSEEKSYIATDTVKLLHSFD